MLTFSNEQNNEDLFHLTNVVSRSHYDDTNINTQLTTSHYISPPVQDHQISYDINSEEVAITTFFYKPPNDNQIYDISYKEIPISFEFVSQILNNNSNNNDNDSVQNHIQQNNLHEFYFLKFDEKKCYKVTCILISHSLIIEYLNRNIYGVEIKQNEQQVYVEFSKELKENLEYYLKQFLTSQ
ncbi:hypothetical protein RclHR1_08500002 [Rhizophagus clarus]|uniref:Uncharacterized protein n=1 Tax=Rhizophagus clarus TaxID=94130 RepID=A0A2Z6SNA0_9GLOM|nr:hypothetical protein RclHR1_08500002 [Rhizophagus clarus]GES73922.1 hypothetical protein GLOIN_2v1879663 [Rhizophagus clarus]